MEENRDQTNLPRPRAQKYLRFKLEPRDTALLEQLSEPYRAVLLFQGSYQDCATALNIPIGTVRSRLHRARTALEALRNGQPVMDSRNTQLN